MRIALIRAVFPDDDGRLQPMLERAREQGADLALLPEIPLNPWSPATKDVLDDDAEAPGGERHQRQSAAARAAGIGLVGGAIVRDPESGVRRNTALVFNDRGECLATYAKLHVPDEPGFWEADHYDPGIDPPEVIEGLEMKIGVQICSDMNRPMGSHILAAAGADAILNPRSTEIATAHRWKTMFASTAITTARYVLSACRPEPEQGVLIGGPCCAYAPDGTELAVSEDEITVVQLERETLDAAAKAYPGYLPVRSELYVRGWSGV